MNSVLNKLCTVRLIEPNSISGARGLVERCVVQSYCGIDHRSAMCCPFKPFSSLIHHFFPYGLSSFAHILLGDTMNNSPLERLLRSPFFGEVVPLSGLASKTACVLATAQGQPFITRTGSESFRVSLEKSCHQSSISVPTEEIGNGQRGLSKWMVIPWMVCIGPEDTQESPIMGKVEGLLRDVCQDLQLKSTTSAVQASQSNVMQNAYHFAKYLIGAENASCVNLDSCSEPLKWACTKLYERHAVSALLRLLLFDGSRKHLATLIASKIQLHITKRGSFTLCMHVCAPCTNTPVLQAKLPPHLP